MIDIFHAYTCPLSSFDRMKELGIQPEDRLICFGQLLGMCDNVSFPLGECVSQKK